MRTTDEASVRRARSIADAMRKLLEEHAVPGELALTGGSSLPGLATKGDVDLHLRVSPSDFASAVTRLGEVADAARPEIWTRTFATFERADEPVVGIAVTVIGSEHDIRFTRGWAYLAEHADTRAEYNALKGDGDHEAAKSRFFDRLSTAAEDTGTEH